MAFRIHTLMISAQQEDHIRVKDRVTVQDVDEVCAAALLVLKGRDGSFAIYGRTDSGRSLVLFMYSRGGGRYSLATARDMTSTERRRVQHLTPMDLFAPESDEDDHD